MHYDRYFKPGQKVVLRRVVVPQGEAACLDSLTGWLASCDAAGFVIRPQDAGAGDEILPGTLFELLGDIYDFGMRLTAGFDRVLEDGTIRLLPEGDLEFFFRRQYLRADCSLWLGYRRGASLRPLRGFWQGWSKDPAAVKAAALPPFALHKLSLGAGGVGLAVPAPASEGESFLLFLALDDDKPLICAVAEVVRVETSGSAGLQNVGLQFRNLLENDRRRIELYVRRMLWVQKSESEVS